MCDLCDTFLLRCVICVTHFYYDVWFVWHMSITMCDLCDTCLLRCVICVTHFYYDVWFVWHICTNFAHTQAPSLLFSRWQSGCANETVRGGRWWFGLALDLYSHGGTCSQTVCVNEFFQGKNVFKGFHNFLLQSGCELRWYGSARMTPCLESDTYGQPCLIYPANLAYHIMPTLLAVSCFTGRGGLSCRVVVDTAECGGHCRVVVDTVECSGHCRVWWTL